MTYSPHRFRTGTAALHDNAGVHRIIPPGVRCCDCGTPLNPEPQYVVVTMTGSGSCSFGYYCVECGSEGLSTIGPEKGPPRP